MKTLRLLFMLGGAMVAGCQSVKTLLPTPTSQVVDVQRLGLTNLDVSACSSLLYLNCGLNQLTNLNVSACNELRGMDCSHNPLTYLDVSALNISSNKALTYVDATGNPLTNIVVWWNPPTIANKPSHLKLLYDGNPTFSSPP